MKPCKAAYKIVRKTDSEIYKGFGFKHLSDATAYYVHRNNESFKGTTTLCQSIGESVIFLAEYITAVLNNPDCQGDILTNANGDTIWLDLPVPVDWRGNGITDVCRYHAIMDKTKYIMASPYDKSGNYLECDISNPEKHYFLLPVFVLLLVSLINSDDEYAAAFMKFVRKPSAAAFVTLHEDLYQHFKNHEFTINSYKINDSPTGCTVSLKEKIINFRDNTKKAKDSSSNTTIINFSENHFPEEYRSLIPALSDEFALPDGYRPLCSAITAGDVRSLLLHGPAGTGKTMSCKLICREIHLPVMDTVNCTENLDEFILGKYLPDGEKIISGQGVHFPPGTAVQQAPTPVRLPL